MPLGDTPCTSGVSVMIHGTSEDLRERHNAHPAGLVPLKRAEWAHAATGNRDAERCICALRFDPSGRECAVHERPRPTTGLLAFRTSRCLRARMAWRAGQTERRPHSPASIGAGHPLTSSRENGHATAAPGNEPGRWALKRLPCAEPSPPPTKDHAPQWRAGGLAPNRPRVGPSVQARRARHLTFAPHLPMRSSPPPNVAFLMQGTPKRPGSLLTCPEARQLGAHSRGRNTKEARLGTSGRQHEP